jgi:hypothetical protein
MTTAVVVLMIFSAYTAHVQEPAGTWPRMDLAQLPTIYVTDESGAETTGTLLRFEPDAVVLLVDGAERRLEASRVRRIQKRGDSLTNGALTGALIGVVLGGLSAAIADCPGSRTNCAAFRITAPILSSAFYAAVGTGIDALINGRTTLYIAPATTFSTALVPFARARHGVRAGVRMTVSW